MTLSISNRPSRIVLRFSLYLALLSFAFITAGAQELDKSSPRTAVESG